MKIFPVFIPHAGCPHQCYFCAQDRTTNQSSVPTPEEVSAMLEALLPDKGAGEVAFYGGTFTLLPDNLQGEYLEVAARYIAAGRAASIRISTRPDAVDGQCIERLKSFGVSTVELGCQSFSDDVLHLAGRGHTAADNTSAVQLCRQKGLSVGVQLMPGLPGDVPEVTLSSCRQALELKADFLRIYPTVVVAGTQLANLWHRGEYSPWSLEKAVDVCADILLLCHHSGVPIIRMGLQQDSQLEANLLAGPYHPAFGQLVRSRLWRQLMGRAGAVGHNFFVNPNDLSDAIGHRCENRDWLGECGNDFSLSADISVERGMLRVAGMNLSLYNAYPARI